MSDKTTDLFDILVDLAESDGYTTDPSPIDIPYDEVHLISRILSSIAIVTKGGKADPGYSSNNKFLNQVLASWDHGGVDQVLEDHGELMDDSDGDEDE